MTYNYNRLWKLLIDKDMTKTQMRLEAGISTNILAKMGKGEPVAMDSLAKIATVARATYKHQVFPLLVASVWNVEFCRTILLAKFRRL